VRLNGDEVGERTFAFNLTFTETGEVFALKVQNGVMHHAVGPLPVTALPVTALPVSLTCATLVALLIGEITMEEAVASDSISGETAAFETLLGLLDRFDFWFEIIAP